MVQTERLLFALGRFFLPFGALGKHPSMSEPSLLHILFFAKAVTGRAKQARPRFKKQRANENNENHKLTKLTESLNTKL